MTIAIASVSVQARASLAPSRSYLVPMGELKYILINWLNHDDVEVKSKESERSKVDLMFHRNGKQWKIELMPESAMATQVTLLANNNNRDTLKFEEQLWAFINTYIGPNKSKCKEESESTSIPDIIYSKTDAVVCINVESNGLNSQFSGVIVDSRGTILCTAHDLKKFKTLKITDNDGKEYLGKVVKLDLAQDIALVQSQLKSKNYISLSKGKDFLSKNEQVYAIGCPMNQLGRIITGRVNEPPVKAGQLHYWKVSMETSPGSSGSPVFDAKGVLIGIIKGRFRGTNTIGFLIPMDRIRVFINESEN
jgi:serine protease Do